jgi:hypothetical protein
VIIPLLVVLLSIVVDDVEELELVDALASADDTEPVTELVLLEELLGAVVAVSRRSSLSRKGGVGNVQILEVAAGELVVGEDLNLAVTGAGDLDGLSEVADAAVDLDLLVQELLKSRDVEDVVAGGLRGVDDELRAAR